LEFLLNVTGIPGLPARTAVWNASASQPGWVSSVSAPGWIWQDDTSSDEIAGHMAAYLVAYRFLAQNEQERTRLRNNIVSIVTYIIQSEEACVCFFAGLFILQR
jgi:hypothetical protein